MNISEPHGPRSVSFFSTGDAHTRAVSPKRLRGTDLTAPTCQRRTWGIRSLVQPSEAVAGARAAPGAIGAFDEVWSLEASTSAYVYATRMSPLAFLSHITAAHLWAIPLPQRPSHGRILDVSVRSGDYPPSRKHVRGHRVQVADRDSVEWWSGGVGAGGGEHPLTSPRVTSPARTFCDRSCVLSERELVAAGDFLIWWRRHPQLRPARPDLEDALGRFAGRRGRPQAEAVIAFLSDRADSPAESVRRVIFRDAGLRLRRERTPQ